MRYQDSTENIYAVFATPEWIAEKIKAYPQGVLHETGVDEYLRLNILHSGGALNRKSLSGLLIIDIFTAVKQGPLRSLTLADKLDSYLVDKCFSSEGGISTQFGISSLQSLGIDSANTGLHRSSWTIPFNHFGVVS